jgi:ribonuclease E
MAKRMLIDATHPEETRVVVLNTNRLEEFDFESSTKKQVKGNIYLAKITRVEPSLQAAFVDYGSNRHGFLAFSEIHPDYYKIPVADREPDELEPAYEELETAETEIAETSGISLAAALPETVPVPTTPEAGEDETAEVEATHRSEPTPDKAEPDAPVHEDPSEEPSFRETSPSQALKEPISEGGWLGPEIVSERHEAPPEPEASSLPSAAVLASSDDTIATKMEAVAALSTADILDGAEDRGPEDRGTEDRGPEDQGAEDKGSDDNGIEDNGAALQARAEGDSEDEDSEAFETLGGDELEEAEHHRSRSMRHYKIQEVVKRRQIMLVQVNKEERGTKGAALTTYLSLAGRYCVLMPNTARGGGVSRKITNLTDRRRLKDILEELDIPEGMGVIVRTAGAERSKAEIRRDYEYLLRLWNEIRDLTLRSTAPALIYEEGNLIKRSIRDLYTRDIDEVLVEGEEGYRTAKAFMKMLMPSHAKRVQPYRDNQIGLFHRFQVESQIDAIHSPVVQLRSGGYVVINQTEALVAIDVNSGRSTRERNIEETAVRTNIEAAEEIARQLRLRDLAGLIVIDFIDMEDHRNQIAVERRLKDALKNDRARIQLGRISAFGLLEMSRQRLRPSLVETSTQPCPHCGGTGFIRSTESTALYVLRSIEEEGMRRRAAEICVYVPTPVALYILNQKRDSLVQLEARYGIRVFVARDDTLIPPAFRLERLRAYTPTETAVIPLAPLTQTVDIRADAEDEEIDEAPRASDTEQEGEDERGRSRRRRRRRRRHEEETAPYSTASEEEAVEDAVEEESEVVDEIDRANGDQDESDEEADLERRRRRRGRRGGRRRGRREGGAEHGFEVPRPASDTVEILPAPVFEEAEQTLVTAREDAVAFDTGAIAVETASLPALAGDPLPQAHDIALGESEVSQARPAESGSDEIPHTPPVPIQTGDGSLEPPGPSTAESEQGIPYASESEKVLETVTSSPESEKERQPAHPVQTVTEKPANPRRGWWQRFMQS